MTVRRICSLSVDVDPLACYYGIHGLGEPPAALRQVILERALPRMVELFCRHNVPATFFLIGRCLEDELGRRAASTLSEAGFEIGNHSDTHPYDLLRWSRAEILGEVRRAHARIAAVVGAANAPVGFRAPGYGLSADLLDVLGEVGYRYDSSAFPSAPYYLAKATRLATMAARGRRSGSPLGDPRMLLAPTEPYRPDARHPWRRGQFPVVELPIAATPLLRLPAIGTSLVLAPTKLRAHLLEAMRGRRFFNLELHAIDLLDAAEDHLPDEIVVQQPDLRRALAYKQRALEATLGRLRLEYEFRTLRQVAADVQREGHV